MFLVEFIGGYMVIATNKRSTMTLFTGYTDIISHQIRFILAEKGVPCEFEYILPDQISEEVNSLNPYGKVPVLVDKDLIIYFSHVIVEFLDDRFPYPALMPSNPADRAKCRTLFNRIQLEWYSLAKLAELQTPEGERARKRLRDEILSIDRAFVSSQYLMEQDFSIADCALGVLLWRLTNLGIDITTSQNAKGLRLYMNRIFNRDGFMVSLTQQEREMRVSF